MEKITKREMYETLYELAEDGKIEVTEEMLIAVKDFCAKEIDLLDKKAIKAKERAAKKAKEGDALTDLVKAALTEEYQTIPDIAAVVALEDPDATVAKTQYRLTQLVKSGIAVKQEMVIPATETSKTRRVMGYRLTGFVMPTDSVEE